MPRMTDMLKPYPVYKDSGASWLGEVPEHWEVRRLKQVCRFTYGDSLPTDLRNPGDVPVFGSNGIVGTHSEGNTKAPCIVIGRKGSSGKVNFSFEPVFAIDTTYFIDDRNTNADLRWLYFLLGWLNLDTVSKDSAVPGLSREDAYQELLPLPPPPEQTAIVRFLDWADQRIQRVIRAREQRIKLLEEYKQALIHQAVTGQIDVRTGKPYPKYKHSGVEWLGDVPAHWEVRKLKRLILGRLKYGANEAAQFTEQAWPRYLRITDFDANGKLRDDICRSLPPDLAQDYLVYPGDILLARSGATVGKCFLVSESLGAACHAGYLIRARPNQTIVLPKFLFAFFSSQAFWGWKAAVFIIATIENISAEKYADLATPVPAIKEQTAIVEFLDEQTERIDAAVAADHRVIDLLKEFRTRLIADVVTGKLDVREAAAKLPEKPKESEAKDDLLPKIAEQKLDSNLESTEIE